MKITNDFWLIYRNKYFLIVPKFNKRTYLFKFVSNFPVLFFSIKMKKSFDDYQVDYQKYSDGIIGRGSLSFIKLVKDKTTGELFAMKIVFFFTF